MTRRLSCLLLCALALAGCPRRLDNPDVKWRAPNPPLAPDKQQVRLVFGGDLSLARGLTRVIDRDGGGDPAYIFERIAERVRSADLFFANVEMVLADDDTGEATDKTYRIRAETRMAKGLSAVGMDVASVSNNHAHDFGDVGIESTLLALRDQGIRVTGAILNGESTQSPLVVGVGPLKVGFLAYNTHGFGYRHPDWRPRAAGFQGKKRLPLVERAARDVDVLVVSMHWGGELFHMPRDLAVSRAHDLVDAGADIVIGHGPHVAQPMEEYKGALITYSLGDLVFDKNTEFIRHRTNLRFLLEVEYDGKQRTGWRLVPLGMTRDWRPIVLDDVDAETWVGLPDDDKWAARNALKDARVDRVYGDETRGPVKWTRHRGKHPATFARWLRPRWVFEGDQPGMEIAETVETSGMAPEGGLWVSPHNGGPTRLKFKSALMTGDLEVVAGVPDFPVEQMKTAEPVTLRVRINGLEPFEVEVPHEAGWKRWTIDTSKFAGRKKHIYVEVEGKHRKEPGFVFDLRAR